MGYAADVTRSLKFHKDVVSIHIHEFECADVVRSKLVRHIIERYETA